MVFNRFNLITNKYLFTLSLLLIATSILALSSGKALAAGTLVVSPSTNLTNGQTITVSGTGMAKGSTGSIVECNSDAAQPTVTLAGNQVPVSCTNPLTKLVTTSASGVLAATSFVVHTGTVGPAATGTDSKGNDAASDAANYPCPPTPAQIKAGDSCVITFGDANNDNLSMNISFASQNTPAPSSSSAVSTPAATKPTSTSSSTPASTSLTNTGPGSTIGIFVGVSLIAGLVHYLYSRRKSI